MMLHLYHLQTSRLPSWKDFRAGTYGRTFIYIRNNKGPKIELCGTSHLIGSHLDAMPQNSTRCFLSLRYDLNQL